MGSSKHKFQLRAVDLSLEDYPSVTLGATGHCTPRIGKAHTANETGVLTGQIYSELLAQLDYRV